jgi:hypothetical protein
MIPVTALKDSSHVIVGKAANGGHDDGRKIYILCWGG